MTKRGDGEGSYYARPSGGYLYRVLVNGQRVSGSGKTKAKAKAAAMDRARLVADRPTRETFAELVTEWASLDSSALRLRPTTRDQYLTLVKTHVEPLIGSDLLRDLTKRKMALALRLSDATPATRRATYAATVRILDYAVSSGLLAVNLAREVPRPPAPEPRSRSVEPAAAKGILKAASGHRLEVAAWLGFGLGLRRGEVLGLRWSEVDLDAGTASVTGNVTRSSAGLNRGAPKTKRGTRIVPLPPVVIEQLKAHRKRQAVERLKAGAAWSDLGLVVTNEAGGMVEPRSLSRAWQSWAKAAGVTDTGTHAGRHYAASTLLASGQASVADVAAALGHDPSVLLGTYAVAVASGQRLASDALGASLTASDDSDEDSESVPTVVPTGS